jgi:hypothetical protein
MTGGMALWKCVVVPRVPEAGTGGAMDVLGWGGKRPRGVQGDQARVADGPQGFPPPRLIEAVVQLIKETEARPRLDRVERLTNVIVGGDAFDLEEGTGVVATVSPFQFPLETQERGALGEKDREGRQADVGHGVLGVVAGAPIRQRGDDRTPAADELSEAALIHGPSNAGTGPKVQVTIV